ncbi:MAG: S-layer protein, partial [Candidatus Marsarchaeota archaeon]|nr:S-layer protein [Candidatus Marsarchaeota archaeon]
MKRLNAKKIAAVVTGAALLGFGLAVASPVTISNVQVINNAGQPTVQVVVGSLAKPSDGVAAGNIAAAIGNLAFTQTQKVFPANV